MDPSVAALEDVQTIELPQFVDERGSLIELANAGVPVALARTFLVHGNDGAVRGGHAHLRCTQVFVATSGSVDVLVTDGYASRQVALYRPDRALVIPPLIWASERFVGPSTGLLVLCDRPYEPQDYVRDIGALRALRAEGRKSRDDEKHAM